MAWHLVSEHCTFRGSLIGSIGPIKDTEGLKKLGGAAADVVEEGFAASVPLHRMGKKEEIAMGCVFLANTETSAYITGCTIIIDGGAWLHTPTLASREMLQELAEKRQKSKM